VLAKARSEALKMTPMDCEEVEPKSLVEEVRTVFDMRGSRTRFPGVDF